MRAARIAVCLFVLLVCAPLFAKSKKLVVTGRLTHAAEIGSDSNGWAIVLNPVIILEGQQLSSLEIKSSDERKLDSLQDAFVKAKGTVTYSDRVQSGPRPVLTLSSIKSLTDD